MKKWSPRMTTVTTSRRAALAAAALVLLASILLPPTRAAAGKKEQAPYALIFGTVWGADSQPAYGIKVKLRRADQDKAKWEAVSDHHGEFAFRVPAGRFDYVVQADVKSKDKTAKKPETKVHVDNDERVDVALHLTE
jgi:hypothetical protein